MCVYVCVRVCVWGYSSVTEHLPNMYEILGLITHTHTEFLCITQLKDIDFFINLQILLIKALNINLI
jgi:hypothetical protein